MKKLVVLFSLACVLFGQAYAADAQNAQNASKPVTNQAPANQGANQAVGQPQGYPGNVSYPVNGNFDGSYTNYEGSYQSGIVDGSFQGTPVDGSFQGEGYVDGGFQGGYVAEANVANESSYQANGYQANGSVDMPTGDCYCKRVCYKTCYCKVPRCEYVNKCYQKRHCRWVCQEYQKPVVRYVPVCTYETRTRYVPEYYYTDEVRRCPTWKCEIVEKQIPRYYYQHTCQPECAEQPVQAQECCQ